MAITAMKSTAASAAYKQWPQILAVLSASICYLNRGLHSGWTSPALPKLLNDSSTTLHVTSDEASWIVVLYPASIIVGCPISGYAMSRIGRKFTILLTAIPHLLAFVLIGCATSVEVIYVARFLAGLAEGMTNIVTPVYLGEITEPAIRGVMGAVASGTIIFGLLAINVIGSYTPIVTTSAICSFFPILLLVTFSWMPDSPYYLVMKKKTEGARYALQRLRGVQNVEDELIEITNAVEKQMMNPGTMKQLLCIKSNRKTLFLMMILELIQQFSGIWAIQSYTQIIFIESGQELSSEISAITIMGVQLVSSLSASYFVDRLGRKPLLLISCTGCGLALIAEGLYFYLQNIGMDVSFLSWLPITALIFYVLVYSVGLAIILNVMLGEVFAANIKGKAITINGITYGILACAVSKCFQVMSENVGMFMPFWVYASFCLFGSVFIYSFVPETKGKTLDDIQEWFRK